MILLSGEENNLYFYDMAFDHSVLFREPDLNNQVTAFAMVAADARNPFSSLPLLGKPLPMTSLDMTASL